MKRRAKRTLERVLDGVLRRATRRTRPAGALGQLEAFADQPALRGLARIERWRRARRRPAGKVRMQPELAGSLDLRAPSAAFVDQLAGPSPGAQRYVELLRWSFGRGGYETAAELAERLAPVLETLPKASLRDALAGLSDLAIATGEESRAALLWQRHGETPPAALALRLAKQSAERPEQAFPGGAKPNLYLASQLVAAGKLDAETFARQVLARPLMWLRQPELELVLHQLKLHKDARDVSALSRYLARQGLSGCERPHSARGFLHDLRFAPAARSASDGPLISVLMAARDAAHTIEYAVDSVLSQSYGPIELLIADDASADDTLALLQRRYAGDARVRLFASEQPQGPYNLRNALLAHARGELITFHDADDVSLPCRLARQASALRTSGQVACVSSWLRVRPDGSAVFFAGGHALRLSVVSLLATRQALQAVGPYPRARFGADLDILRRLALRYGEPSRLREPLLLGLWSSQSLTRTRQAESLESGYRAPARRHYAELLFRRDLLGAEALPQARLEQELQRSDNFIEPRPLRAL